MARSLPHRQPPRASELVDVLVDAVPGFSDSCSIGDDLVPLHRKAQQLAAGLHERFAAEDPGRFAFTDIDELSADSGEGAWRASHLGQSAAPHMIVQSTCFAGYAVSLAGH